MSRPNILFILTDDQGYWSLGCYGNKEVKTPNLDRLAERGMRFDNFFCVSPVCSPARASLLTGRIPSQHGIHDWLAAGDTYDREQEPAGEGRITEYLAGQTGYSDILANNGYICGISGKWHMGDSHHPQKGFQFWKVHCKGGGPYYDAPMVQGDKVVKAPEYVTDLITDNALEFLEQQKNNSAPFYLSVHYTAPHSPWERNHHPHEAFDDYHANCPFESVPSGLEPPEWAEKLLMPVRDEATRRIWLSGYYTAITEMDRNVGRLLDWLEANDMTDNTLICFTTDNGMNMGHHGIFGKGNATFPMNMYEESVKVPFIMALPGTIPQGTACDALLSHYDFMPTLLDLLDMEYPQTKTLPGRSFKSELDGSGDNQADRDSIIIYDEYGPVRMIRTAEWKYIHRYPYGPHELYYLSQDPGEKFNLFDNPQYDKTLCELRRKLQAWFVKYVNPEYDGARQPVTGYGQIHRVDQGGGGKYAFSSK